MRDLDALVKTIQHIELLLAEYIELGRRDPHVTIDRVLAVMDQYEA